jgi:hypothetical protein
VDLFSNPASAAEVNHCDHGFPDLSFAKTPAVSKINSLRNFLRLAFCYEFDPCSTSYGFGSASSFAFFDLARL